MDKLVRIKNLAKAAKHLGRDIAHSRNIPLSQFKNYITPREVQSIIKQHAIMNDNCDYLINHKILSKICNEIDTWVLGIELAKLASLDSVETYWDNEKNCMIFSYKKD